MFIKTYDLDPSKRDRLYMINPWPSKLIQTLLNKLTHLFDSMLPYQTVNKNIKLHINYKTMLNTTAMLVITKVQ